MRRSSRPIRNPPFAVLCASRSGLNGIATLNLPNLELSHRRTKRWGSAVSFGGSLPLTLAMVIVVLLSEADLLLDTAEERGRFPRKHRTHDNMNSTRPTMFLIGDNISGDATVESRHGREE
ncbi:unnamed protein product [Eruca vesicaria subsp. sativa]|uniref:Uncharacterized protein n=1 Tax=Eruca vesicaria subsp. sativa TaxID=29727 RepID=A0ABC8KRL3_ERUVS|nr:unnamed protein product [Eruca vesicaria subsp. sativa]